LVDEVEQLLAVDGPARAKTATPPGEYRRFDLVDQF